MYAVITVRYEIYEVAETYESAREKLLDWSQDVGDMRIMPCTKSFFDNFADENNHGPFNFEVVDGVFSLVDERK